MAFPLHLNAQQGSITITGGCPSLDFCFNPGKCDKGLVRIKLTRTTTCANSTYTDVSYKLDLNNDGFSQRNPQDHLARNR
jgi:hypothetical protein